MLRSTFGLISQAASWGMRRELSMPASASASQTFELPEWKTYNLPDEPARSCEASKEELLKYFSQMYLIRRVETVADALYKAKLIRGFLHLYNGQEAVAVGTEASITKDDHVITAYRDHAYQILRGDTPESTLAELLGKVTGCSKGNGGSMHMYYKKGNFHGGNGIVGAQVPIGAGLALAEKYKGTKNVSLSFYGDGASNQGQLFEAYNMAALWKLPALFICENNQYGMGTAIERASSSTAFYQRFPAIPGLWINGMDVLAVKTGVSYAVERARKGLGPIIIEISTYRYVGHSMSDPGTTYRSREEIQAVREKRDPIESTKRRLLDSGLATEEEITQIEKDIRNQITQAEKNAKAAPVPPAQQLYENVYVSDLSKLPVRTVELSDTYVPQ